MANWLGELRQVEWRFVTKPFLLLVALSALFNGVKGLQEASAYRHVSVVTCAQFLNHPAQDGWFRITDGVLDLENAAYESSSSGGVTKVYAPVHSAAEEPTIGPRLVVETTEAEDLEWVQNLLTASGRNNTEEQERWTDEHRSRLHPQRVIEGMLRVDRVKSRVYSLRDVLRPDDLLLSEGERPNFWLALVLLVAGVLGGLLVGGSIWRDVRTGPDRWLRRKRLARNAPLIESSGLLVRVGSHPLIPGSRVEIPSDHQGIVCWNGALYDSLAAGRHGVDAAALPILASHAPREMWGEPRLEAMLLLVRLGTVEWRWSSKADRKTVWQEEVAPIEGTALLHVADGMKLLDGLVYLLKHHHRDATSEQSRGLDFWGFMETRRAVAALPACGDQMLADYVGQFVYAAIGDRWAMVRPNDPIPQALTQQALDAINRGCQDLGLTCTDVALRPISGWKPPLCDRCGASGADTRKTYAMAAAGAVFFTWLAYKRGCYCRGCGLRLTTTAFLITALTCWLSPMSLMYGLVYLFMDAREIVLLLGCSSRSVGT